MNNMEQKQFFLPGDLVTIRQDLPMKPKMIVVKKVTKNIKIDGQRNDYFQGILCRWFTTELMLQEAIFNTKDLKKVK